MKTHYLRQGFIRFRGIHILLWLVLSLLIQYIYYDPRAPLLQQILGTLVVTAMCALPAYYGAYRLVPQLLYKKTNPCIHRGIDSCRRAEFPAHLPDRRHAVSVNRRQANVLFADLCCILNRCLNHCQQHCDFPSRVPSKLLPTASAWKSGCMR